MSKQTVKGHIFYDTSKHADLTFGRWRFFSGQSESFGTYIPVCPHELTFDQPADFDPRPIEIRALEKRAAEIQAEATAKRTEIFRRISELQAITFEAGEA
jgi:hypothetical protein